MSLSARRAWIEIDIPANLDADHAVALRKESVDRNRMVGTQSKLGKRVALRKESVDRNSSVGSGNIPNQQRRSPQGERG